MTIIDPTTYEELLVDPDVHEIYGTGDITYRTVSGETLAVPNRVSVQTGLQIIQRLVGETGEPEGWRS